MNRDILPINYTYCLRVEANLIVFTSLQTLYLYSWRVEYRLSPLSILALSPPAAEDNHFTLARTRYVSSNILHLRSHTRLNSTPQQHVNT